MAKAELEKEVRRGIESEVAKRLRVIRRTVGQLTETEKLLDQWSPSKSVRVEVRVLSLWEDHGEKSVTVRGKGSLRELIAKGVAKYKKVNNRSDLQAKVHVYAILPGKVEIPLPRYLYDEYAKEHKAGG